MGYERSLILLYSSLLRCREVAILIVNSPIFPFIQGVLNIIPSTKKEPISQKINVNPFVIKKT